MFARCLFLPLLLAAMVALPASADGPKDNDPAKVNPIPPVGNDIPAADRDEIMKGLAELQGLIKDIGKHELLPDVQIYEKAVRWALEYKEIFDGKGAKPATNVKKVLAAGLERAKAMKDGKTPWTTATGGVLRGYKSKIDGSVQPYWIIVPKDYDFTAKTNHRLDFWWHGRFENVVEAGFMANSPGSGSGIIPAPGALILHPFGRFSNANKFAGEVDTFECLEHAKKHYRIDVSRIVARGFSMGGAACWQFGTHFPTLWAACAPGAGFSETPEFLKVYQNEKVEPTWYEKKLWHMYNASDYALNIFDLPTVAYSGEDDSQKQAADVMAREMKKVGLELTHIIGAKAKHFYTPEGRKIVNEKIDAIVEKGKPEMPVEIKFVTYTLQYNKCAWLTIEGLGKHWEQAKVEAAFAKAGVLLSTENVTAIRIEAPKGVDAITIDGEHKPLAPGNLYVKTDGKWQLAPKLDTNTLAKRPGLQGPIDDAFMDAFIMVPPSGLGHSSETTAWTDAEFKHACAHWRSQFRGDAPVKKDNEITADDIANNNLILWGDPSSNAVLAKIADKLPIKWDNKNVIVGDKTYDAGKHMPALIFPNPLNPKKYVVLNSGFTFREYDYLNNARQVSRMPDYAVIDITSPATSRYPGKVVQAGFFDEKWQLQKDDGK